MNLNEFFANDNVRIILEDAFATIVDGAGTVRIEDGGVDQDDPGIQYVSVKDLDLEAHIGLTPLGAFTLLRGHDALSLLALLYALVNEEEIAASGSDASAVIRAMNDQFARQVNA